ncbi:GSCFA domain-containing protein [Kocuria sp.]|uniref:GSCFA domain-containing protein n=1 Tax=Kocuria sp. TaxID=1871328 RepID=UPI0026DEED24|nr:GSCFA domain-containing protein [Kocuria sp.]MDO5617804.1 GSCFA domain-containing protein [Kocuria sp.]
MTELRGMYRKKFPITPQSTVVTAGSCFAQHISRYLRHAGYNVLDAEPGPQNLPIDLLQEHGYGIYSARYGNIYFVRQLLQLALESMDRWEPADAVWPMGERWIDALRPSVEPAGLLAAEHVRRQRVDHLAAVRRLLEEADVFVFTMGLTEGWEHIASGTVYPTAPGTIGGSFNPEIHRFHNFTVSEIVDDFRQFRDLVQQINPDIKFLLTVSPVPLAATATDHNVLTATTLSKAVLRAAAGELEAAFDDVDYFPSYEIVTCHAPGNQPFDETGRNVRPETVAKVMAYFLAEHVGKSEIMDSTTESGYESPDKHTVRSGESYAATDERVFCEEAILEAFSNEN